MFHLHHNILLQFHMCYLFGLSYLYIWDRLDGIHSILYILNLKWYLQQKIKLFAKIKDDLKKSFAALKQKCQQHPELFGVEEDEAESKYGRKKAKALLDALYEEGIIPTYSFPKNVVSTYIQNNYGKIQYEVDRGLDIAIGEYAPGRAIVVDKQTYQIGGFFYPGSEQRRGQLLSPARTYTEDPNYVKAILTCPECGWFGLKEEQITRCPFCGNSPLQLARDMMRPWGFAPRNAEAIPEAQLEEEYTAVQQPLYSTLPEAEEMKLAPMPMDKGCIGH